MLNTLKFFSVVVVSGLLVSLIPAPRSTALRTRMRLQMTGWIAVAGLAAISLFPIAAVAYPMHSEAIERPCEISQPGEKASTIKGRCSIFIAAGYLIFELDAMQERGRMQKGMVADITIFDPKTITDNSTYAKGTIPASGIPHVIVNGVIVMKDSEPLKGVNPGQPIRFPVENAGRHKGLSVDKWKGKYTVTPIDFGGGVPDTHVH